MALGRVTLLMTDSFGSSGSATQSHLPRRARARGLSKSGPLPSSGLMARFPQSSHVPPWRVPPIPLVPSPPLIGILKSKHASPARRVSTRRATPSLIRSSVHRRIVLARDGRGACSALATWPPVQGLRDCTGRVGVAARPGLPFGVKAGWCKDAAVHQPLSVHVAGCRPWV
eukprot:scaffold34371_cov129-Isochrysis_galbana.AAC.1